MDYSYPTLITIAATGYHVVRRLKRVSRVFSLLSHAFWAVIALSGFFAVRSLTSDDHTLHNIWTTIGQWKGAL